MGNWVIERDQHMTCILVIDDDAQIRQMLRQMLQRKGYLVVEAADGNEGITLMRTEPIDLVITDIIMPEKEGIETIIEIQRDFPDVKIIAISGGGRIGAQHILKTAESFGVTHTFAKPFGQEGLLKAIKELLGVPAFDTTLP